MLFTRCDVTNVSELIGSSLIGQVRPEDRRLKVLDSNQRPFHDNRTGSTHLGRRWTTGNKWVGFGTDHHPRYWPYLLVCRWREISPHQRHPLLEQELWLGWFLPHLNRKPFTITRWYIIQLNNWSELLFILLRFISNSFRILLILNVLKIEQF